MDFGAQYGYEFEHEATYDRMCLVNDAVYIAKYSSIQDCMDQYGYCPGDNKKKENKWTATGTQFQVPYVFKKLFSKEELIFDDLCETKSVTSSMYIDMNEELCMEHGDDCNMHNYIFIGRVGRFCPIKSGCGGGVLYREKDGKYYAVTGTKGYRWLEAEMVKQLNKQEDIDHEHFIELVDKAKETIDMYGDFEWFASDDPYVKPNYLEGEYGLYPDYEEDIPFIGPTKLK